MAEALLTTKGWLRNRNALCGMASVASSGVAGLALLASLAPPLARSHPMDLDDGNATSHATQAHPLVLTLQQLVANDQPAHLLHCAAAAARLLE